MKTNTNPKEIRYPFDEEEEELFLFRHNGGGSYYVTGPGDYMLRRGIDLCQDLSIGNLRSQFLADSDLLGGKLEALMTWIVFDWSNNPGNNLRGSAGTTVIFPTRRGNFA